VLKGEDMKQFEQWFNNTWELLSLEGSGKMVLNYEEFKQYLEEAYKTGYEKQLTDLEDQLE
jgi:hypothetical protein